MGKLKLVTLALALLALGAEAGCGSDRTRRSSGLISVAPRTVDFGRVGLGATVTREIALDNFGRAPLQIVRWSVPGEGKDLFISIRGGRRLREGERAVLVLRFTPTDAGKLERSLVLETDDPRNLAFEVPLQGEGVMPQVEVDPVALDFGRVELGIEETLPLTLTNRFDIPVEVRLGSRGDDQFSSEPRDVIQVEPHTAVPLSVHFKPRRLGSAQGLLALLPCPTCEEVLVSLDGTGIDKALVVVPPELDFGYVPTERSATRSFTVTNVSSRPVEILSMRQSVGRPTFRFQPVVRPLPPGDSLSVQVEFSPTHVDPDEDWIEIASTSRRAPLVRVHLLGAGGGPQIQVSPSAFDFGLTPVGSRPQIDLIITNAGTTPAAPPLRILDIRVENPVTAPFGADRDLVADPVVLFAGEQARVPIGYEPPAATEDGEDRAELVVVSNDTALPEIRIPMRGSAFVAPPCDNLELTPGRLDFGQLDEGAGAVLSFQIRNPGPRTCIMRNLRIAPGSDPVFQVREVASFLVPAGGWFGWMVAFDPRSAGVGRGSWHGEVELFAVNATQQRYSIPLTAASGDGCLVPEPRFLDFGVEQDGCGHRDGRVSFTNHCPEAVAVDSISLGEPSSPDEFEILAAPGAPFSLPPGGSFAVDVRWNTLVRGINSAPLYVAEGGRSRPLMVPLLGELLKDGRVVDEFVQHRDDAVDVLLVVDNSTSMVEEPPRLLAAAPTLVEEAERMGIDFHFAVTSTGLVPTSIPGCGGGAQGGEAGRFFPADGARPRIVTPSTPNAGEVFAANTQVGNCHELEQGLEAMRLALSEPLVSGMNANFLRQDARLALIFVGDEDDHSGFTVRSYLDFLVGLKGNGGVLVNGIVDRGDGCPEGAGTAERVIELIQSTGGRVESICPSNWRPAMRRIAERIFTARSGFDLSETPADPGALAVTVNGVPQPERAWRYEAGPNRIHFEAGFEPPPGASIQVTYATACR